MAILGKTQATGQGLITGAAIARRRLLAPALLAAMLGLGGCSVPNWADPTEWFGDDAPATVTPASRETDERFPNLGRVPPRPVEQSTTAERNQALNTLSADRSNARYTDEELRARPSSSNALPPAPAAPTTALPTQANTARAPQLQGGSVPAAQVRELAMSRGELTNPRAQGQNAGATTVLAPSNAAPIAAPPQAMAQMQAGANMGNVYAANLMASAATTLPAGLQQQAMNAPAGTSPMPSALTPGVNAQPTGARFGAPVATPAAMANGQAQQGSELLAIVRFANGSVSLDARDKALLRQVAEYQKGFASGPKLRVVGHASSRTGDMTAGGNRQMNYDLSRRRAEAVAAELARLHVDARAMIVEARADASPVYYEAMPLAEEYNRRVEIYLER